MEVVKVVKESFSVIGKEGSTKDGQGFIDKLWEDAIEHFDEISYMAKKGADGSILGVWGAMSDFSRSFMPWEDGFSRGLYLAGVEVENDCEAIDGWTKWTLPAYEFLRFKLNEDESFADAVEYLEKRGYELVGAVHDNTNPATKENFMYFPIKKL